MIIDCHGHYTTSPKALDEWRDRQLAAIADPNRKAYGPAPTISDDELRETIENGQLKKLQARGSDLTLFSPRAAGMAHHVGNQKTSEDWARVCNDLIYRVSSMFPKNFIGVAQLPQSLEGAPKDCIPEMVRCIEELGFVGVNLNPDPSGGYWKTSPLYSPDWYPLYEKMVELDVPAMIHVSSSCNACHHATGAHYINGDTTAFMQFVQSDLFRDFPTLKFVIPHGGGAAPYHWGRYRGLALNLGKGKLSEHLLDNVFFDTCVYHQPGVELLAQVIP